jgi:ABC-type multidrug transport system fused ATPase/permease subunit
LVANVVAGLQLSWQAAPAALLGVAGLAVLSSVIPTAEVWLSKRLVDGVVSARRAAPLSIDLWLTVAVMGLLAALQRALSGIEGYRRDLYTEWVRQEAELRLAAKTASVDLGRFDDPDWHDRMARAGREVGWRTTNLAYTSIGLGGSLLTLGGLLGLLLAISPALVGLALLSVLPVVAIQRRANRRIYSFWFGNTPADRERGYVRGILTEPEWAKEVRAFDLGGHLLRRYRTLSERMITTLRDLYRSAGRASMIGAAVSGAALAGAYGVMAARGVAGSLTAGDLTASITAIAAIVGQLGLIASSLLVLEQNGSFLDDYFSFLSLPPLIEVSPRPVTVPRRAAIEFRGVGFRYPGADRPALSGLDLTVQAGELVALVGENGAGKTSLVKLLLRLYDPQTGCVLFGGVDLRELDPVALRSRIGVLFQDYRNYELTARDNVTLGRIERAGGDGEVRAALEAARAAELVARLACGLDSNVGRLFEGAHDLSTGEWQRLALARLIYRDADVWVLDEPTASLDPRSEAAIFAELRHQLHGRTGIVISHRFSTMRVADRIAVLADGQVIELGTHEELVAMGGRYAELFELQAAGYR